MTDMPVNIPPAPPAACFPSKVFASGRLHRSFACAAIGTALLLAIAGCQKPKSSIPRPPDTDAPLHRLEADPDARVRELQKEQADFAVIVHKMPGTSMQQDRETIRQAFSALNQLLPLVNVGPHGGVFDHQRSVVADTQTLLAGSSSDLSAAPIIDRGLRAAYNALDDAQHSGSIYYEDPALHATLDRLSAKLQELDTARGAQHNLAWADVFNLMDDAIARMASLLADRLSETGTTAPTTMPATAPATAPAGPTTSPAAPMTDSATPAMPATPATSPTTAPGV